MTWSRLDDAYFLHPKSRAAGKDGRALDLAAICYCSSAGTNGVVSATALPMILALAEVKRPTVKKLVDCGRWDVIDGGWMVHDYLDYNPDAQTVQDRREARARAGSIGGKRSKPPSKPEASASVFASTPAEAKQKQNGTPSPSPTGNSSSCWEPPDPLPVDKVAQLVGSVIDRCVAHRASGKTIANRNAYERTVRVEFDARTSELERIIGSHPGAPADVLAGWMLGQENSLRTYRQETA